MHKEYILDDEEIEKLAFNKEDLIKIVQYGERHIRNDLIKIIAQETKCSECSNDKIIQMYTEYEDYLESYEYISKMNEEIKKDKYNQIIQWYKISEVKNYINSLKDDQEYKKYIYKYVYSDDYLDEAIDDDLIEAIDDDLDEEIDDYLDEAFFEELRAKKFKENMLQFEKNTSRRKKIFVKLDYIAKNYDENILKILVKNTNLNANTEKEKRKGRDTTKNRYFDICNYIIHYKNILEMHANDVEYVKSKLSEQGEYSKLCVTKALIYENYKWIEDLYLKEIIKSSKKKDKEAYKLLVDDLRNNRENIELNENLEKLSNTFEIKQAMKKVSDLKVNLVREIIENRHEKIEYSDIHKKISKLENTIIFLIKDRKDDHRLKRKNIINELIRDNNMWIKNICNESKETKDLYRECREFLNSEKYYDFATESGKKHKRLLSLLSNNQLVKNMFKYNAIYESNLAFNYEEKFYVELIKDKTEVRAD